MSEGLALVFIAQPQMWAVQDCCDTIRGAVASCCAESQYSICLSNKSSASWVNVVVDGRKRREEGC